MSARRDLRGAAVLAGLSLLCLSLLSWSHLPGPSRAPHYLYQADAWLNGQLHLTQAPPNGNDWAKVGDRWYVSFPPMPALLMLPGVALFGLRFSDVIFTLLVGALNAGLIFLVLQRLSRLGRSERDRRENLWLSLLFVFGTVHAWCAIRGEVWYTAQTLGVAFTLLYVLSVLELRHPLLAGLALGMGVLCRPSLAFTLPVFLYEAYRRRREEPRGVGTAVVLFGLPLVVLGAAAMWHNAARFDDVLEFGHRFLHNNRVGPDVRRWGLFDYHYLERNLHAAFTRIPHRAEHFPWLKHGGHGMSIFITTPAWLLLCRPRRSDAFMGALWVAVLCCALPALFYMNTGYYQFGYRFSLDYSPYLLILLALGARPLDRRFAVLMALGVAVNIWGAIVFNR